MILERRCKITFIAHGATIFSDENRISDLENYPPLNDAGYDEIDRICAFLKKRAIKNDAIYASSGMRTSETAEIIAKVYRATPIIVEGLSPRKCGEWNNLTIQQLIKRQPNSIQNMLAHPQQPACEGAEALTDFIARVEEKVEEIIDKNLGNRIILVTYPDVIQATIVSALGLPPEKLFNFYIKTGSATQISYYKDFNSLKYSGYCPLY